MTVRLLKVFIEVVESGSVTRASENLYIAQPAVSQAINDLESHLNVKLFDRINRRLKITDNGKIFYYKAKRLCTSFDELELEMKTHNSNLKIGATLSIANLTLPKVITNLKDINFSKIEIFNTDKIINLLNNNEIDIALIEGNVYDKNLKTLPYHLDTIVFVGSCKLNMTDKQKLILREQGSGTRKMVEQTLEKIPAKFDIMTVSNIEIIKKLVLLEKGITAISKDLVSRELKSGKLKILDYPKIERQFKIVYHKDKIISTPMQKVIDLLNK